MHLDEFRIIYSLFLLFTLLFELEMSIPHTGVCTQAAL